MLETESRPSRARTPWPLIARLARRQDETWEKARDKIAQGEFFGLLPEGALQYFYALSGFRPGVATKLAVLRLWTLERAIFGGG